MPRYTKPLSVKEIDQAKPREKEYSLQDGQGLALRVRPSGAKLWVFNYYHPHTKKRSNISLGPYPKFSLLEARQLSIETTTLLKQGIDPKEHREEQKRTHQEAGRNTLEAVARQWLKVKEPQVTKNYAEDIMRSLEIHIFPTLGNIPIHKLHARQVIATLEPIAAKGQLETIKRLCQRLNEVMIYATNSGLIEHNTLSGISKAFPNPQAQHMPTLTPERLPELMQALNTANIKITTRCLIEWQLHTITRPNEAAGTRWDEIDFDKALWVIPATRMKKRQSHSIPLVPQALSLLEVMKPISGHKEFVFPADRYPDRHTHNQTANAALKRMGFAGELVSHGLRALASTILNEQGFDYDIIESALAHVDKNSVRKAYNRAQYVERRRKMMHWWSEHVEQAATGNMSLSGMKTLRAVG